MSTPTPVRVLKIATQNIMLAGGEFVMAWPAMAVFEITEELDKHTPDELNSNASVIREKTVAMAKIGHRYGCEASGQTYNEDELLTFLNAATAEEVKLILTMGKTDDPLVEAPVTTSA